MTEPRGDTRPPQVAALLTCHNRRALTVASVGRLVAQAEKLRVDLRVYVTDDGSTDGTAEALKQVSGRITVIPGSGSLYWAGGMALAESAAMKEDPDYLLWLNDDTMLEEDAVARLLLTSARHPGAIVVGATRDPRSGRLTYGGRRRTSAWHPQRFELLSIAPEPQPCDTFNGNIVLIPRDARSSVGAIDSAFPHAYADDDYGLRATAMGISVIQAPGTLGECLPNPGPGQVRGLASWRAAQGPKGLPWRAQARFLRRHGGPAWPAIFVAQQIRMLFPARTGSREGS